MPVTSTRSLTPSPAPHARGHQAVVIHGLLTHVAGTSLHFPRQLPATRVLCPHSAGSARSLPRDGPVAVKLERLVLTMKRATNDARDASMPGFSLPAIADGHARSRVLLDERDQLHARILLSKGKRGRARYHPGHHLLDRVEQQGTCVHAFHQRQNMRGAMIGSIRPGIHAHPLVETYITQDTDVARSQACISSGQRAQPGEKVRQLIDGAGISSGDCDGPRGAATIFPGSQPPSQPGTHLFKEPGERGCCSLNATVHSVIAHIHWSTAARAFSISQPPSLQVCVPTAYKAPHDRQTQGFHLRPARLLAGPHRP